MQDFSFLNDFLNSPRAGTSTVGSVPPVATQTKPLATVGLTPGYTPDYKNLILSDPSYLSYKNNANMSVAQAASARKAALQALSMQYGGLPSGFADQYGDITQPTLDLARGNQFSDIARLGRNYDQGVLGVKQSLAARGGLQSGELGYGLGQADLARASGEYDAGQQFGNTAQSVINSYVGTENSVRQAQSDALAKAEQNVYANPDNRPAAGTSAALHPDWQTKYGVPVYIGADGKLYTLDGSGNPVEGEPPLLGAPPLSGGVVTPPAPLAPGAPGPSLNPVRPVNNSQAANALNNTIVNKTTQPKAVTRNPQSMTLEQARRILGGMHL